MNELSAPGIHLGYCASVHGAGDLPAMLANLEKYATKVRRLINPASPDTPMGIGLWMPADVAGALIANHQVGMLRSRLENWGLVSFTFNGFPQGNFHEASVKHRVYVPDRSQPQRLQYTLDLAHILCGLLTTPSEGSISTLPLGWRNAPSSTSASLPAVDLAQAVRQLRTLADELDRLRQQTGNLIHVDLEPEPGCLVQQADEMIEIFAGRLWQDTTTAQRQRLRDHIRVCHDICHSSVLFEDSCRVLHQYQQAGVRIGKVQISSALHVDFDRLDHAPAQETRRSLESFAEPRYLHQTVIQREQSRLFFADLPQALANIPQDQVPRGQWRVHFHVPIHAPRAGLLETTQADIRPCVALAAQMGVRHFEVETYAWSVLPPEMQVDDLAEGIARELRWIRE